MVLFNNDHTKLDFYINFSYNTLISHSNNAYMINEDILTVIITVK